ncbi:myb-like protein X [Parasponia andersonii]|uniref:Myb-like protein X n=1 Tax=Parasponia andersonii TaxID=3476 RepID=A0A2P5DP42_PARAD|nr:myb-like protein X [Parasponia andersonii]
MGFYGFFNRFRPNRQWEQTLNEMLLMMVFDDEQVIILYWPNSGLNFQAGDVRGDMVHGQEHFFCSVPVLEHQCWKLRERPEKHKEKKHRKDKKDKDKREHKEKKDRERSKEKNGERKYRKEKHRDKKERKEDKGKNGTPNEKRGEGRLDCRNGEKLVRNGHQTFQVKDYKYVQDLEDRIKKDTGATGSQVVQKFTVTDKRGAELPNHFRERERVKDTKEYDWKVNIQKNHVKERNLANSFDHDLSRVDQRRVEGAFRPLDKVVEKQVEGKGENKYKELNGQEYKPKDIGEEKKSNIKGKAKSKEREKIEKRKEINRPSIEQHQQLKNSKPSTDTSNGKQFHFPQINNDRSDAVGILGKRKELEINGDLHGNGFLPHKLSKSASSHPAVENGRKLEPCQTATQFTSERQRASNNGKLGIKECGINGLRGPEPSNSILINSSSCPSQVKENGEASTNPPHPDAIYLSQILSVPKMGEWSDYDDQEWLFNSSCVHPKKPMGASHWIEETPQPQVWAEASQIPSVDLFALPYVIPY